jgi:hypothetical protein
MKCSPHVVRRFDIRKGFVRSCQALARVEGPTFRELSNHVAEVSQDRFAELRRAARVYADAQPFFDDSIFQLRQTLNVTSRFIDWLFGGERLAENKRSFASHLCVRPMRRAESLPRIAD